MIKDLLYLISFLTVCGTSLLACAASGSAQHTAVNDPAISKEYFSVTSVTPQDEAPKKTGRPYVIKGVTYYPLESVSDDYAEVGIASWYGSDFHGKKTANGEIYNMYEMTAAHKTLPLPTFVRVKNLENDKEAVVRVNDRGPFSKGRIIDLSYAAAKELGMADAGTARVRLTVLSQTPDHLRTEGRDVDINKGVYAVQIGSFADQNNANRLAARYNSAIVRKALVDSKTFYRVQLRGYESKHEASAAAKSFESEFPGAFVIAE